MKADCASPTSTEFLIFHLYLSLLLIWIYFLLIPLMWCIFYTVLYGFYLFIIFYVLYPFMFLIPLMWRLFLTIFTDSILVYLVICIFVCDFACLITLITLSCNYSYWHFVFCFVVLSSPQTRLPLSVSKVQCLFCNIVFLNFKLMLVCEKTLSTLFWRRYMTKVFFFINCFIKMKHKH